MFVLQCSLETKRRNTPVYFGGMTQIGVSYTESLDEAIKFEAKEDAMNDSAYSFALAFFEPVEI